MLYNSVWINKFCLTLPGPFNSSFLLLENFIEENHLGITKGSHRNVSYIINKRIEGYLNI